MKDEYAMTDDEYAGLRIRGEQPREPMTNDEKLRAALADLRADVDRVIGLMPDDNSWIGFLEMVRAKLSKKGEYR